MTFQLTDTQRLLDNARTNLPGALDTAIVQEVFNVLDDFFNHTNIWWEDIIFAVTTANTVGTTVDITPSDGGRINRLLGVFVGDPCTPRRMTMPTPGTLLFVDVPNQSDTWTARCALSVTDPLTASGEQQGFPQAPDFVLSKYHQGLTAGVVANMMIQVGKPYTNAKMATVHMAKYRNAVAEAKSETRRQNLFGAQAWRFPGFA